MIQKKLLRKFQVVWDQDPAFDRQADGWDAAWKKYVESRDPSGLPVKDGLKPCIFHCKPLTMNGYGRLLSEPTKLGQCVEAVRYGLDKVDGFEVDGLPMAFDTTSFEQDGKDKRLKSDVLEQLFDPLIFLSVGSAIIDESQLDPTRARG